MSVLDTNKYNIIKTQIERVFDSHACDIDDYRCIIADIAYAKAKHVQINWQDNILAGSWEHFAQHIESFNQ